MVPSTESSLHHESALEPKIISAAFVVIAFVTLVLISLLIVDEYVRIRTTVGTELIHESTKDAFIIDQIIDSRLRRADVAAGTEKVLALGRLSRVQATALSREDLASLLRELQSQGFVWIKFVRNDGLVLESGKRFHSGLPVLSIKNTVPAVLGRADGFYLETRRIIRNSDGTPLGSLLAQQVFPTLDGIFQQDARNGKSHNLLLCGPSEGHAVCFASRTEKAPPIEPNGKDQRNGMQDARPGKAGAGLGIIGPNNRLIATSLPLAKTGLNATEILDVSEALAPLYGQVVGLVFISLLLLLIGRIILRRTLHPLIAELVSQRERALKNEQRFLAAAENSLNSFFIFDSVRDNDGQIVDFEFVYLNRLAEELIGRKSVLVLGKKLCEEIPVNRSEGFLERYRQVVETGIPLNAEFPVATSDILASWLHYQVVRLGDGIAITAGDVSARKQMEFELERSLGFTQAIIDASVFSTVVTDLEGTILAANPATERLLGYSKVEMIGKMTPLAFHEAEEIRLRAADLSLELRETIAPSMEVFFARPKKGLSDQGEWTYIRKDGTRLPVQLTMTALNGPCNNPSGYIAKAIDITVRKRQQNDPSYITYDALTKLPTRLLFRKSVEAALQRVIKTGELCALFLIDLDNFKDLNDSFGHFAGDAALIEIGQRLLAATDARNTVSRIGGDEFIILLESVSGDTEATAFASALLNILAEPITVGDSAVTLSARIGISVYPEGGKTFDTLLNNADAAMYHAKRSGKGGYTLFTKAFSDAATRRIQIEMGLKKAIELNELTLLYQPQVGLESTAIVGVEALLRWTSNKLGEVSPAEFIPLAEQSGEIIPIGEWVLSTACRDLAAASRTTGQTLKLAVNYSPKQLERESIVLEIEQTLSQTGFPAAQLEIEITEGLLMSDSTNVWGSLNRIRAMGIQTAIDDFGTGFSNISYLLKVAVNRIKIDRSFIICLEEDPSCDAVVSSLIYMARNLKLLVVAEGVETKGQQDILRIKGCQEAQGYLFHRPMNIAKLEEVLSARQSQKSAVH